MKTDTPPSAAVLSKLSEKLSYWEMAQPSTTEANVCEAAGLSCARFSGRMLILTTARTATDAGGADGGAKGGGGDGGGGMSGGGRGAPNSSTVHRGST